MMQVWHAAWTPSAGETAEESRRRAKDLLAGGLGLMYHEVEGTGFQGVCHDPFGRPYLPEHPELYISLSHGSGCAAAAAAAFPIGVDTERVRSFSAFAARRALTPAEQAALSEADDPQTFFFRLWTLKESFVKAKGVGLSYGLRRVSFSFHGEEAVCSEPGCRCGCTKENGVITSYCMLMR